MPDTWSKLLSGEITVREVLNTGLAELMIGPLYDRCDTLDREELLTACREQGTLSTFGREETITVPRLTDAEADHAEALNHLSRQYRTRSRFTCRIGPVKLVGEQPLCLLPDGRIVTEVAEAMRQNVKWRLFDFIQANGPVRTVAALWGGVDGDDPTFERVFPLVRYPGTSYYHWLLGTLGRYHLFEDDETLTSDEVTILIQQDPPDWVTESLRLVGCDPDDCVEWGGGVETCSELIVPSHNARHNNEYNPSKTEVTWLRERMLSNADASVDFPERIYISRQDVNSRTVENAQEVHDLVRRHGFRVYTLSSLSVSEQIELFSDASVILGPHGAGMTNILFGQNLTVFELFPESRIRMFFYSLATQLGHDYHWTVEESDADGNILVDTDRLELRLQAVL